MKRSEFVRAVARRLPRQFGWLLAARRLYRHRLPKALADHWLFETLEADLWSPDSALIAQSVPLPNGMRIEVDPRDAIGRQIMIGGHERETMAVFDRLLRPGMVFFDIGAHVGQYSLLASPKVGPNGSVVAFEPHPALFPMLARNVRRNRCANIVANNVAVSHTDGASTLCLASADNIGATSLRAPENDTGERVTVPTIALDMYVRTRGISRVDVMKLDIEGAELDALRGGERVLIDNPDVRIIFETYEPAARAFGRSNADVSGFLRTLGFEIFKIEPDARLTPYPEREFGHTAFNALATRSIAGFHAFPPDRAPGSGQPRGQGERARGTEGVTGVSK
jgi:FkbM family methyltransferase